MDTSVSDPVCAFESPPRWYSGPQLLSKPTNVQLQGEELTPLSGKPFFHLILSKSHVKPHCRMVLPSKAHQLLPCAMVSLVLTHGGKKWEMVYHGDNCGQKRFDTKWRNFVIDNDLKVGDACLFEIVESDIRMVHIAVHILRGDVPTELLEKVNGETSDTPIVID